MLDFDGINRLVGTPDMMALGRRYEGAVAVPPGRRDTP
jgi:hypothetical protein